MHSEFIEFLRSYKPSEVIVSEGDQQNQDFFCLLQGKVGIWKGDADASATKVDSVKVGEIAGKGTYFGEMSALLHETRTASIIALDQVKVLQFPGGMLPQMIFKQPALGLKLCTMLANRLKGTTSNQQNVTLQRDEIRDDATSQFLHSREALQRVFMILTAIQTKIQNPLIKSLIEYMGRDKLLQGGRKIRFTEDFFSEMPAQLTEIVKKSYAEIMDDSGISV